MTIDIPVWLLWTLGAVFGVAAVVGIVIVCVFAWVGSAFINSFGRGLRW